jgi:hypothetical protein
MSDSFKYYRSEAVLRELLKAELTEPSPDHVRIKVGNSVWLNLTRSELEQLHTLLHKMDRESKEYGE